MSEITQSIHLVPSKESFQILVCYVYDFVAIKTGKIRLTIKKPLSFIRVDIIFSNRKYIPFSRERIVIAEILADKFSISTSFRMETNLMIF